MPKTRTKGRRSSSRRQIRKNRLRNQSKKKRGGNKTCQRVGNGRIWGNSGEFYYPGSGVCWPGDLAR